MCDFGYPNYKSKQSKKRLSGKQPSDPKARKPIFLRGLGSYDQEESERVRERVKASYILSRDIAAIESVAKRENVILSFREAGEATLAKLQAGAAPKPHSIGDKSMKKKEFEKAGESDSPFVPLLSGLVPYRNKEEIEGLYLSSKGKDFLQLQR